MSNGLVRKLQVIFLATALSAGAIADDRWPVLRSQKDASRERGWTLTPRGVVVVDYKPRETSVFVRLPQWVWAGEAFMCPPDLAIGPKGEALITSNVMPSLWRIDPVSLRVTKHDLVIDAHTGKDVGFTGLIYAAELGVFIAISDFGALWRIDPLLRRVRGARQNWSVHFAPDQRSAYVRQSCNQRE